VFSFTSIIQKFSSRGEKTGWTYVEIPPELVVKLQLPSKRGFRIKGIMDDVKFSRLSTYPVGGGNFIVAINRDLKKKLAKKEGALLRIKFQLDEKKAPQSPELLIALKEEKKALQVFRKQPFSHQNYFHRYVAAAKTKATRATRIVNIITAMYRGQDFGAMIRSLKK
jgi:hypothetical protein